MIGDQIQALTSRCDRKDCMVVSEGGTATLLAWKSVYDKTGKLLNEDPNTYRQNFSCQTCGAEWAIVTTYNASTILHLGKTKA
jgi:hypothetical protein